MRTLRWIETNSLSIRDVRADGSYSEDTISYTMQPVHVLGDRFRVNATGSLIARVYARLDDKWVEIQRFEAVDEIRIPKDLAMDFVEEMLSPVEGVR